MRDCPEDQIGISIPRPLNARFDALVEATNRHGENTSRKELLAALILVASEAPEELTAALRTYRTARAVDAATSDADASRFLSDRERRPGPRPRRQD